MLFLMSNLALAADQTPINLGRWSNTELGQIIASARQIESPGKRIVSLSRHFIDTRYVANSLIGGPQTAEQLVINLAGFDCFTYLDTVEALRRSTIAKDIPEQLKQVRYRNGTLSYENRRHFFSDWVAGDNGGVVDVTSAVGPDRARVVVKQLNLKGDGSHWVTGIPVVRREIAYIPVSKINREVLSALRTGDYVGIYSNHPGLDVSHTGLLVKDGDRFQLRHASSRRSSRRVVDVDLLEYLQGKPGLVVYRAREVCCQVGRLDSRNESRGLEPSGNLVCKVAG